MQMTRSGDWGTIRQRIRTLQTQLFPFMQAKLGEQGEMVLERIREHIDAQDLVWTPLKEKTVRSKGSKQIYIESGFLRNNLKVEKITFSNNQIQLFIGASNSIKHPTDLSLAQLMVYLEYGTHVIPPRPIIRPSFEEVRAVIRRDLAEHLRNFLRKGV